MTKIISRKSVAGPNHAGRMIKNTLLLTSITIRPSVEPSAATSKKTRGRPIFLYFYTKRVKYFTSNNHNGVRLRPSSMPGGKGMEHRQG